MKIGTATLTPTPTARLLQQVETNTVPSDLYLGPGHQLNQHGIGIPLSAATAERQGKGRYATYVGGTIAAMAMAGSAMGMLGGQALAQGLAGHEWLWQHPFLPMVAGVAAGALVGAAVGLDHGKDFSGRTTVELDGQQEKSTWKGNANLRSRSPGELKALLTAVDVLGDDIPPASGKASATPEQLQRVKPYKQEILSLAGQRRLVADLGVSSRYGKPCLQLVDSNLAADLLARSEKLYALSADQVTDTPHRLRATSQRGDRNELTLEDHRYTERNVSYALTSLTSPEDLKSVHPQAKGVPEGMAGVYRDESSTSLPVLRHSESGQRQFLEKGQERQSHSVMDASKLGAPKVVKSGVQSGLSQLTRTSTKPYAVGSAIFGALTASALGVPAVAGIMVGGAVGHLAGRASIGAEPGSAVPRVVRYAMTSAGAVAGVGLALHGGPQASLLAGAAGGLMVGVFAGVKAERHGSSRDTAVTCASLGLTAGSLLGMYAGASGAAWAVVPLAVLGGLGGAGLGRLCSAG